MRQPLSDACLVIALLLSLIAAAASSASRTGHGPGADRRYLPLVSFEIAAMAPAEEPTAEEQATIDLVAEARRAGP